MADYPWWQSGGGSSCAGGVCPVGYPEAPTTTPTNPYRGLLDTRQPWYMDAQSGVSPTTQKALLQADLTGKTRRLKEMEDRLRALELSRRDIAPRPENAFRRWLVDMGIWQTKGRISKYKTAVESCADTYRRVMARAQAQSAAQPRGGGGSDRTTAVVIR